MTSYKPEDWTVSSNDVLKLSIVDDYGVASFHPTFTYPIFGDSEQIFGFRDLQIELRFDSVSFLTLLLVHAKESLPNKDLGKEIIDKLKEYLPSSTIINDEERFNKSISKARDTAIDHFNSMEVINRYKVKNESFKIVKTSFNNGLNLNSVELLKRLQIFVLLFIEAGSYINTQDNLWDFYLIISESTNKIIGFTTVYSYLKFNNSAEFDESFKHKIRIKISQFLILPPYQQKNHGKFLYNCLFDYWLNNNKLVEEVTIEDPNEKFDNLRLLNDFKRLFEDGFLNNLPKNLKLLNNNWFLLNSKKFKLEINEFKKIIELSFLYFENIKIARLLIKKRLFEKNRDGLLDLEISVRNDKLQTAYNHIKDDYEKLIKMIKNVNYVEENSASTLVEQTAGTKRKLELKEEENSDTKKPKEENV